MPGLTRAGIDTAGGLVATTPQAFVSCEGFLLALVGSTVASHGSSPHNSATLAVGSTLLFVGGVPVVFAGLPATCGDVTTGSLAVQVAN